MHGDRVWLDLETAASYVTALDTHGQPGDASVMTAFGR